jgi:putative isomerase
VNTNRFLDDPFLQSLRPKLQPQQDLMRRGILTDVDTGRQYFTGYSYKTLYDWDQYFEAIVQIYMGWPSDLIKNGVTIFLDHQQDSGMISRSVPSNQYHDPEHIKPFLAQIVMLIYRAYNELNWILDPHYFNRLQKYIDYWLEQMDSQHIGLCEWMSAPHTGMDNQHERAGYWLDRFCQGVDLNSYLVRELQAFAQIAEMSHQDELASIYRQKAADRAETIRKLLWDETDGFFYDRNARADETPMSRHAGWGAMNYRQTDERIRVKAASSFTALWAGVATPEQARRMVFEHLFNAGEFWTPYPVAALAKSERWYTRDWYPSDLGCNWRAMTWIPTNFMIYHGLRRYGYRDLASLVAQSTHQLVTRSGDREYYDTETGAGMGLDPFWGWSLLGHFLPFEEQLDVFIHALPVAPIHR